MSLHSINAHVEVDVDMSKPHDETARQIGDAMAREINRELARLTEDDMVWRKPTLRERARHFFRGFIDYLLLGRERRWYE